MPVNNLIRFGVFPSNFFQIFIMFAFSVMPSLGSYKYYAKCSVPFDPNLHCIRNFYPSLTCVIDAGSLYSD